MPNILNYLRQKNRERLAGRRARTREEFQGCLAVLAIMKNEAMNLDEWMSHYLQVGADRIILIDNGSTDDTRSKAEEWLKSGRLDFISRPEPHRQAKHYWEAIRRFVLRRYQWLLIADLDEFWFCPDSKTIPTKLKESRFSEIDVVYANWRMFGSNGLIEHPDSIRTKLLRCNPTLETHINTKYICRTSVLTSRKSVGIHKVFGADSSRTVSDNESFNLFHYPIQSLEFFQRVKMTRGDAANADSDKVRDMKYFRKYDAPCTYVDRTLADMVQNNRLGIE